MTESRTFKFKFKLQFGKHIDVDPVSLDARNKALAEGKTGKDLPELKERTFTAPATIESDEDLSALYGAEKYFPIGAGIGINSELNIRVGESIAAFAARMQELAEKQGNATLHPDAPAQPVTQPTGFDLSATLAAMTVEELKKHAASENIPLGSAKLKPDIIAVIMGHHPSPNEE